MITGEEGRGKTSLIGALEAALGARFTVGVLALDLAEGGFQSVLSAFGSQGSSLSRLEARNSLRELLENRQRAGRPCVLLIDDAHRTPEPVARALERFVGAGAGGLKVVMTVPPTGLHGGFLAATSRTEIELGPLNPEEAAAYIRHRVRVAGGPADLFDEPAARELGSASRGAPQALDRLAAACLAAAAVRGAQRIDVDLVRAMTGSGGGRSQAAVADARSDGADAAGAGAAAMGTLFERLWMQAETDEFRFSASPAAAPPGVGAAVAAPEAIPAAPSVGERHAPSDGLHPVQVACAEGGRPPAGRSHRGDWDAAPGGARIPRRAGAPRRSADARTSGSLASGGASRGKAAVSAAMVIAGLTIGAGIGWQTAPWGFAAGAGGAAAPIGLEAAADEVKPSSWAVAAVPAAAEGGAGGEKVSLHRAAPAEWEADARALYERGVGAEDPEAAITAYARAALRGHERSARYLGQIYELGEGVEATPRLARAWYDFAEGGAAPSASPEVASRTGAPFDAPVTMFSARTPDGAVELVWSGGGGGAGYTVEFARDPLGEPVPSLVTTISAALVTVPEDVAFWRVVARGGGPEGGWTPIGPPTAP